MKKANKKGFTIVELVIVIAVIAILAAVLIPTFSSLIEKANISNDTGIIKNLNTAMAIAEVTEGKCVTMTEALQAATDIGYNIDKLTPNTEGYHYTWNSNTNKFSLLDESFNPVAPDNTDKTNKENNWLIAQSEEDFATFQTDNGYSVYINYVPTTTIPATAGVDMGTQTNDVSYTGTVDAVIRMNGGTLTVNTDASVYSYGKKDSVEIVKVAVQSYHEFGEVIGNIELTAGRVVLEQTASAPTVLITATTTTGISVDVKTTESVTVAATEQTVASALSTVVTGSDSVVSKVETAIDQAKVSLFAGGLGTKESPYLIETAEHFANVNTLFASSSDPYFFKQIADIKATTHIDQFAGGYDGNGHSWTALYCSSSHLYSYMFNEIVGHVEIKNLKVEMDSYPITLFIALDLGSTAYGADFDNIEFNSDKMLQTNHPNFGFITVNPLYTSSGFPTAVYNFKNIVNNADVQNGGTCTGFLIGSGPCFNSPAVLNYENCVNNGTIIGTSQVGFLYGNGTYIESMVGNTLNVISCKNNGSLLSMQGSSAIVSVAPNYEKVDPTFNDRYENELGGVFRSSNYFDDDSVGYAGINQNGSNLTINLTQSGQITYKLAISVGSIYQMANGTAWNTEYESDLKDAMENGYIYISNSNRYYANLTVDKNATETVNKFHAYDYRTAVKLGIVESGAELTYVDGYCLIVKDGINCLIINLGENIYINSACTLSVYAYDNNGQLIGIKDVK